VKGAKVDLLVVEHTRGPKIRGFKYKCKINYKRAWGHRDDLTVVRVEKIKA
jgi:large subunit ribosomal protein L21